MKTFPSFKEYLGAWNMIPIKIKVFLFLLVLSIVICGCAFFNYETFKKVISKYPDDNPVEEVLEEIIADKYNVDVDLSPFSPED